ncbi:hypothetical protein SAMN05443574_1094 [Haloarcula vallismortis]|uniref:Uncharacterized protein n=2 Tax=Haloarcula vallismortis TaxID=28442 RepID=M0JPH7_HALVA|nr:DUF5804 family protein [Haloarcula vallismortis]EMA10288.1 hypothetical protein C437_03256 [Haloarcula vallismortis ATCC 29715]SDW88988.1 hypothetical protein SAMN05443574_1094 [Haloarcula vallismortis]
MTQVCLVGTEDVNLRYELLSRETARNALATYDLQEPFANTVAVDTVSLGAAVALLNDLNWYLVRFADAAFIRDPSISETEWLSRNLAASIRDDDVMPADTGRFLKVYGIVESNRASDADDEATSEKESTPDTQATEAGGPPELVEPMLLTRTGDTIPEYDLQDVDETLIVRVTESEFGA